MKHELYDFDGAKSLLTGAAENEAVAFYIKYIGSSESCLITVDATAKTISSAVGVLGSEAADANFTYPSGGTDGTIDLTDSGINTLGEFCDFVNSLDDYEVIPWVCLRSHTHSTAEDYQDVAGVQAKSASNARTAGVPVYWTTATAKKYGAVISGMQFGPRSGAAGGSDTYLYRENGLNELDYFTFTPTYGGTASLKLYEIMGKTETEIISFALGDSGAATTVNMATYFKDDCYRATPGARILMLFVDDTSMSTMADAICAGKHIPML